MTSSDDPFGADEPEAQPTRPAPHEGDQPAGEPVVTTHFGSADEFVRKQLIGTYRRRVIAQGSGAGFRWKAAWWESKEAQQRIEALWRAWEAARADEKAGMSAWWIEHCDPHMSVLLSPEGPFADSTDENRIGDPLPYEPADEGLFEPDLQPPLLTQLLKDEAATTTP
ncbi:DUF4913 domain-containing protein [Subtercola boreus]|uniref:DUF4913 domain-containing protein n=1 Tax=Subtercola boreus TaxID=120213 RepID=A0A3E0W5K5_9MICO|nr:DUF4913 domain-containing protein [Subtercola boreus]RFA17742.1 hypothetical protein B7R24_16465 [Subtercola boreus]RFA17771.1 hypothetical protein B7R23_16635 [Subtercola boreus]RFA24503.1 hypothetical protein B7R25_16630 [Subtercola boreus]